MGEVRPFQPLRRRYESVVPRGDMPTVACAFCDSTDTEAAAIYGCHMMTAQYYCRACRSVFDWVRDEPLGPEVSGS